LQDLFFCLLFQPYPLTPLPVFGCMGLLCGVDWLPPVYMFGVLCVFLNGSVVVYLYLFLRMQQELIFGQSCAKLSPRSQLLATSILVVCSVWVVVAFFCSAAEHPNREEAIQEMIISWLERYSKHIIVFGGRVGDTGRLRGFLLKFAVYNFFCYSSMVLLIFLILRELKRHAKFESSQKRLCRTARTLLTELLAGSLLYFFPSLIIVLLKFYPPPFIPDIIYFMARIFFVMCFSLQSITYPIIFLSEHQYGKELRKRLYNYIS
ncbi:hypothetical protein PMAYCL1PPCAC_17257, partial [Pristionchus mayeri]